jgi:hypothetical protein
LLWSAGSTEASEWHVRKSPTRHRWARYPVPSRFTPPLKRRVLEAPAHASVSSPTLDPLTTDQGFTLSLAKQALHGKMDDVIETVERNVRLL